MLTQDQASGAIRRLNQLRQHETMFDHELLEASGLCGQLASSYEQAITLQPHHASPDLEAAITDLRTCQERLLATVRQRYRERRLSCTADSSETIKATPV